MWVPEVLDGTAVLNRFHAIWNTSTEVVKRITLAAPNGIVNIEEVLPPDTDPEVVHYLSTHSRQVPISQPPGPSNYQLAKGPNWLRAKRSNEFSLELASESASEMHCYSLESTHSKTTTENNLG